MLPPMIYASSVSPVGKHKHHPETSYSFNRPGKLTLKVVKASAHTSNDDLTIQSKNFHNTPCPLLGLLVSTSSKLRIFPSGLGSSYSTSAATASNLSASRKMPPQGVALS